MSNNWKGKKMSEYCNHPLYIDVTCKCISNVTERRNYFCGLNVEYGKVQQYFFLGSQKFNVIVVISYSGISCFFVIHYIEQELIFPRKKHDLCLTCLLYEPTYYFLLRLEIVSHVLYIGVSLCPCIVHPQSMKMFQHRIKHVTFRSGTKCNRILPPLFSKAVIHGTNAIHYISPKIKLENPPQVYCLEATLF